MRDVYQSTYSLPRWRLTKWLTATDADVPPAIKRAVVGSLFGSLPVFIGGVLNSLVVAFVCARHEESWPFLGWLVAETCICCARTLVLIRSRRASAAGRTTPTDLHMLLALCWAASVGYGAFASLVSGDWIVATIACVSAAAMVGGICVRNFGAPRFVCAMILLSLGPVCPAALLTGQPLMLAAFIQTPLYAFAMTAAAFQLHRLLVSTMRSEQESVQMARRDDLTGLLNRAGLSAMSLKPRRQGVGAGGLAVYYLDLDLFKAVNDRYGHAGGDVVLQNVADRLRRELRRSDHAARIGGDEFVAVVHDIDEINARLLAERLVAEIGEAPYVLPSGAVARLGVSVGLAYCGPGDDEQSFEDLLAAADHALYEAKANGRSQYRATRVSAAA
jgi:diguanylate cyclase